MTNQEGVNWASVLSFLQKEQTQISIRQKEWNLERHMLLDKINRLESQLDSNRIIINDLMNRIKLLEIALFENNLTESVFKYAVEIGRFSKSLKLVEKIQALSQGKIRRPFPIPHIANINLFRILSQIGIDSKQVMIPSDNHDSESRVAFQKETALKFKEVGSINGHLDGIRKLYVNDGKDFVISVSEDCLVKLWSYSNLMKNKFQHLQPTKTYRQHTGPLFALTGGSSPFNPQQSIFFTGGSQGLIKYWKIHNKNYADSATPIATWSCSQQLENGAAIWDMALSNNKLLCSTSDGLIKLYQVQDSDKNNQKCQFKEKQFKSTCLTWLSSETFIQGCSNAPRAHIWDLNGKIKEKFLYETDKGSQAESHQINQICYARNMKMIVLGCEDGSLRLFPTNFSRMIRKINTNSSVSCVKLVKDWQLVCGTHSGSISAWDLRNYRKILQLQKCHLQKYDEGVFCLWTQSDKMMSGGADGVLKIYS